MRRQRQSIGNTSIQYTNWFLKEIAEEVNQVIIAIYEEHCKMGDKVGAVVQQRPGALTAEPCWCWARM